MNNRRYHQEKQSAPLCSFPLMERLQLEHWSGKGKRESEREPITLRKISNYKSAIQLSVVIKCVVSAGALLFVALLLSSYSSLACDVKVTDIDV